MLVVQPYKYLVGMTQVFAQKEMDTVISFIEEENLFLKAKPGVYLVDFLFKADSKGKV
jgi:hypothetical protein